MERAIDAICSPADASESRHVRLGFLLIVAVALVAPIVVGAGTASAETNLSDLSEAEKQKMQEFLQAGKEEYEKGNFESAIPFLKKAHEIFPKPAFHYRIALAYERSGQPRKALEYYRTFLEAKPETEKRGQVEKTIARLEKQVADRSRATIRVESKPSEAEVSIGAGSNETRGTTPMEMRVDPGEIKLVVEKNGYGTVSESVEVEAGKSYEYNYTLPPSRTASTGSLRALPLALAGTGVATLIGAGIYDLAADCTVNKNIATTEKCFTQSEYQTRALTFGLITGAGAAALGTAGILWATGGVRHGASGDATAEADSPVSLRFSIRPTGVTFSGTF